MRRTDRRSDCPINFALELFGDPWSLLVVRDLAFKGKRTYSDFAASEERIATNVLATRLRDLRAAGVITREGRGRATRYALTAKGLDLLPLLVEMILWSARHDARTAAPPAFVRSARRDRARLLREMEVRVRAAHGIPYRPPNTTGSQ